MRYCPDCGQALRFNGVQHDVPTDHYSFSCKNGHGWVETMTKDGELVHITRKEEPGEPKQ